MVACAARTFSRPKDIEEAAASYKDGTGMGMGYGDELVDETTFGLGP